MLAFEGKKIKFDYKEFKMEKCMPLRSLAVCLMFLSLSPLSLNLHRFSVRNLVGGYTNCTNRLYILLGRADLSFVFRIFSVGAGDRLWCLSVAREANFASGCAKACG